MTALRESAPVLRPATVEDRELLFAWANDPGTRIGSFHSDPIPPEVHRRWFDESLAGGKRSLHMLEIGGVSAGLIRLDHTAEPGAAEIGITEAADSPFPRCTQPQPRRSISGCAG